MVMYDEGSIKWFIVLLSNSSGDEENLLENLQDGLSTVAELITNWRFIPIEVFLGPD